MQIYNINNGKALSAVAISPKRKRDAIELVAQDVLSAAEKENGESASKVQRREAQKLEASPTDTVPSDSEQASPAAVSQLYQRALATVNSPTRVDDLEMLVEPFWTTHPFSLLPPNQQVELANLYAPFSKLKAFVESVVDSLQQQKLVLQLNGAALCRLALVLSAAEIVNPELFFAIGDRLDEVLESEDVDIRRLIEAASSFADTRLVNWTVMSGIAAKSDFNSLRMLSGDHLLALLLTICETKDRQLLKTVRCTARAMSEEQLVALPAKTLVNLVINLADYGLESVSIYAIAARILGRQERFDASVPHEDIIKLARVYSRVVPMPQETSLFRAICYSASQLNSPIFFKPELACDLANSFAAVNWRLERDIIWFGGKPQGNEYPINEPNRTLAMQGIINLAQGGHGQERLLPKDIAQMLLGGHIEQIPHWSQQDLLWALLACCYADVPITTHTMRVIQTVIATQLSLTSWSASSYNTFLYQIIISDKIDWRQHDPRLLQEINRKLNTSGDLLKLDGDELARLIIALAPFGHDMGVIDRAQKLLLGPGKLTKLRWDTLSNLIMTLQGFQVGRETFLTIAEDRLVKILTSHI